jgi:hypothetical protein
VRELGVRAGLEGGKTVLLAFPPFEQEDQVAKDSVPFFGKIPPIGRLFLTVRHGRYPVQDPLLTTVHPSRCAAPERHLKP